MKKMFLAIVTVGIMMLVGANVQAAGVDDFMITVKTDNPGASSDLQFTIGTAFGGVYNYNVDCDAVGNPGTITASAQHGDYTCTYPAAGTYTIRIEDNVGDSTGFPQFSAWAGGDEKKLTEINQWGTIKWTSMESAFNSCTNLAGQATDTPDLSGVTNISQMFYRAPLFNQNLAGWDTSTIEHMNGTFEDATSFNQDLSSWNVANVQHMNGMFQNATAFNGNITNWNTGNVEQMIQTFSGATNFNQDISGWNVANVESMAELFSYGASFNQDISGWNVANVNNMRQMFLRATSFDQDLGRWDVSGVTSIEGMFESATLSTDNYDSLLINWDKLNLTSGLNFDGGNSNYCSGADARQHMISSDGWTITDAGKKCAAVASSKTSSNEKLYNKYRRKYKNKKSKIAYREIKRLKRGTIAEFAMYMKHKDIYKKYKHLSKPERMKYMTPEDYAKFKKYRLYKGYKEYKRLRKKVR